MADKKNGKPVDNEIVSQIVNYSPDQFLSGADAEAYTDAQKRMAQLADAIDRATQNDAESEESEEAHARIRRELRAQRIGLLKTLFALQKTAEGTFSERYSEYTAELEEAFVIVATNVITDTRKDMIEILKEEGASVEEARNWNVGPIHTWIGTDTGPETYARLFYAQDFSDEALYGYIMAVTKHIRAAIAHNEETAEREGAWIASTAEKLITQKWELQTNDIPVSALSENTRIAWTPATRLMNHVQAFGKNIKKDEYSRRRSAVSHDTETELKDNGGEIKVSAVSTKSKSAAKFNIDSLVQYEPATKIFDIILDRVITHALGAHGQLIADEVTFPLSLLVDRGLYDSERSAYYGIHKSEAAITGIRIGYVRKSHMLRESALMTPVYALGVKNGTVHASLAKVVNGVAFDWRGFTATYFTLPSYVFGLSIDAYRLARAVYGTIRQNHRSIKRNGYCTVSIQSLSIEMGLPSAQRVKDPKNRILERIDRAAEELEEAQRHHGNGNGVQFEYMSDSGKTRDMLNGKLKIIPIGDVKRDSLKLDSKQDKKIKAAVQKAKNATSKVSKSKKP